MKTTDIITGLRSLVNSAGISGHQRESVEAAIGALSFASIKVSHDKRFAVLRSDNQQVLIEQDEEEHLWRERAWLILGADPSALIEDIASGASQARADRFFANLDAREKACNMAVLKLVARAGYESWHTGGGCMAWRKDLPNGEYLLITADNDIDGKPNKQEWIIGRYGNGDGWININETFTLKAAIAAAETLPSLEGIENCVADLFETLSEAQSFVQLIRDGKAKATVREIPITDETNEELERKARKGGDQ